MHPLPLRSATAQFHCQTQVCSELAIDSDWGKASMAVVVIAEIIGAGGQWNRLGMGRRAKRRLFSFCLSKCCTIREFFSGVLMCIICLGCRDDPTCVFRKSSTDGLRAVTCPRAACCHMVPRALSHVSPRSVTCSLGVLSNGPPASCHMFPPRPS